MDYEWDRKKTFELKEEHLKLLQNTYIRWDDCEYGAPAIDSKRPFGNSGRYTIILEMAETLGIKTFKDVEGYDTVTEEQAEYLETLWGETQTALQIILRNRTFKPGVFEATGYSVDWKRVSDSSMSTKIEENSE